MSDQVITVRCGNFFGPVGVDVNSIRPRSRCSLIVARAIDPLHRERKPRPNPVRDCSHCASDRAQKCVAMRRILVMLLLGILPFPF